MSDSLGTYLQVIVGSSKALQRLFHIAKPEILFVFSSSTKCDDICCLSCGIEGHICASQQLLSCTDCACLIQLWLC